MEAGTAVIAKGWNVDDILDFLHNYGANIEKDNDGQIIIYTNLYENEEGGLSVL
jgi:hypothetical protein